MMNKIRHRFPGAIILLANYAELNGGEIRYTNICSRMLLWCEGGGGELTVNRRKFDFSSGSFLFLPWAHSISYRPSPRLLLGGVHIIPFMKRVSEIDFSLPHGGTALPPEKAASRRDIEIPGINGIYAGQFDRNSPLYLLANYIVSRFRTGDRSEDFLRFYAGELLRELTAFAGSPEPVPVNYPSALQSAMNYIDRNLSSKISLDDLSRVSGCGRASLFRLFRKYCAATPIDWVLERRMKKARELLGSSGLRISEVGGRVGINDPYYFSKLFKRHTGQTPSAFRRANTLMLR